MYSETQLLEWMNFWDIVWSVTWNLKDLLYRTPSASRELYPATSPHLVIFPLRSQGSKDGSPPVAIVGKPGIEFFYELAGINDRCEDASELPSLYRRICSCVCSCLRCSSSLQWPVRKPVRPICPGRKFQSARMFLRCSFLFFISVYWITKFVSRPCKRYGCPLSGYILCYSETFYTNVSWHLVVLP